MVLGGLYRPKGLALETAKAVLESDRVMAVNVASGCTNGCAYPCYVPLITKSRVMRFPKEAPADIVKRQLDEMQPSERPEGVFLSFLTDPFLQRNYEATEKLIELLRFQYNIKVATLSKMSMSVWRGVRSGVTVVSTSEGFWKKFEIGTLAPNLRLLKLDSIWKDAFKWVSMEPYPPSAIWKQDFTAFLEELKPVGLNLIVFGKLNYNAQAKTDLARKEYADHIETLRDFCRSNHIRLHIKSDTLRFIQEGSQ